MPDAGSVPPDGGAQRSERQRWMAILAKATAAEVEAAWAALPEPPVYERLRAPESGLVMVRGRAGGTGEPFNLGEATMSRCVVRLADGVAGFGYCLGRDPRKAERMAAFDALLQGPAAAPARAAVARLAQMQAERRRREAGRVAATKVEFFTMVRE